MQPENLRDVFEYTFEQMQLVSTPTSLTLTLLYEPDVGRGAIMVRHQVEDLISEDLIAAGGVYLLPGSVGLHLRNLVEEWLISSERAAPARQMRSAPF